MTKTAGADRGAQVETAYLLAYNRRPNSAELHRNLNYINGHSLDSLCWAILNSSEFLYVP